LFVFDFRFRRRVTIPQGVNHESVTSTMSPEGILTIMAPKMMLEGKRVFFF
jgi:HSP20 family molecular chaperone IbpA